MGEIDTKSNEMNRRVYSPEGISPTLVTCAGGGQEKKIGETEMNDLRIRKLTEGECMRLMGFEEKDTLACKEKGLSKANIYHQSGDSLITTIMVGIIGELFDLDYTTTIEQYVDKLHNEVI